MSLRSLIRSSRRQLSRPILRCVSLRGAGVLALIAIVGVTSGCDRLKAAVKGDAGPSGDPVWQADSTLLASNPGLLFRVLDHPKGRAVAPIAVIGKSGFRRVRMGARGWRALDLNYLQAGSSLDALRDGRLAGTVQMTRGMWLSGGSQLDTLGDQCQVPAGLADAPAGVRLAVSGVRPKLNAVTSLSDGELASAISKIPTLIAPSVGIAPSMLGRYQREVHVLNTGINAKPTILITYNDPEPASDKETPIAQRPRQFIVLLDKGTYGYRPSYTYTTVGNVFSPPKLTYLDYVDVDTDGKAELFFGLKDASGKFDLTVALRFESDAWRQVMEEIVRCAVAIRRF